MNESCQSEASDSVWFNLQILYPQATDHTCQTSHFQSKYREFKSFVYVHSFPRHYGSNSNNEFYTLKVCRENKKWTRQNLSGYMARLTAQATARLDYFAVRRNCLFHYGLLTMLKYIEMKDFATLVSSTTSVLGSSVKTVGLLGGGSHGLASGAWQTESLSSQLLGESLLSENVINNKNNKKKTFQ